MNRATHRVIVVGGGWAGLSAACTLARQGYAVTLFEAARQLGGRARRVRFDQQAIDNGQHLLTGAYHDTLALLHTLGVNTSEYLCREALSLRLRARNGDDFTLRAPHLPAPLHILTALLGSRGLSLRDRIRAAGMCLRLARSGFRLDTDISVQALLARHGQGARPCEVLWHPLCLAIMNIPPARASAEVFLTVLHDSFAHRRRDTDLLFPTTDLGHLLADPARKTLERLGATVHLGQRVSALEIDASGVRGIIADKQHHAARHVVLALPPHACLPLLAPHPALHTIAEQLTHFRYEPICTIYLQYPTSVRLAQTMTGLLGTTVHWLIDRRICAQPGLIAAVISAGGPHMRLDNSALIARVHDDIAHHFPDWPAPLSTRIIREKRATFACEVGINRDRPLATTAVRGCWLAGDHTRTGYPATLEGAVRSGLQCARHIMAANSD